MTILNGTTQPATFEVARYKEMIGDAKRGKDVPTGLYYDLSRDHKLKPRQTLVLEF